MRMHGDHRPYRTIVLQACVLAGCLTASAAAPVTARAPYQIPNPLPFSYNDIHSVVYGEIPAYLEAAQCGGYANTSVEGRIAEVTGVPGRSGEWDGALASGMAKRLDAYEYPDEATGLSVAHYTESPLCKELLNTNEPGCHTPDECHNLCEEANKVQYDVWLVTYDCKHQDCQEICEDVCREEPDPNYPEGPPITVCETQCRTECYDVFYTTTNQGYFDFRGASDQFNCARCIDGDEQQPYEAGREFAGRKYACTGDANEEQSGMLSVPYGWVWGDNSGSAILENLPQCKPFWIEERTEYPNCATCGIEDKISVPDATEPDAKNEETPGAECRCGENDQGNLTEGCRLTERMSPLNDTFYWSFYRTYPGKYERTEAVDTAPEVLENEGDAFCFGPYEEFDPAKRQTTKDDQRCVIDIDVSQLRDEQTGYGSYGAPDDSTGPDPNDVEWQRQYGPLANMVFDQSRDLWFLGFGRAFSLLSQPVFNGTLASALLTIDAADQTAAWQTDDTPWAEHSYVRAFDDTGEYRSISRWWQQQQTLAQRAIVRPSILRVILPAPEALGMSPDDPLFVGATPKPAPTDRHAASIDIQVDTQGAILDEALSGLERMFRLRLEPLHVPIVVPTGSPTEYRVLSETWCLQWMAQSGDSDCNNASPGIQALRDRLEEYAKRIEDVRRLRAELPYTVGRALELQSDMYSPIIEWMQTNIALYATYLQQRQEVFALLPAWKENQEKMRRFSEEINMPWCMNRRFTTPIYSLLDPWLPTRYEGGSRAAYALDAGLPSLPELPRQDAVIDISGLRLENGGGLSIPVFDVTQVKLALLDYLPGNVLTDPDPQLPPSLPSLDPALSAMRSATEAIAAPPVVVLDPPPTIALPPITTPEVQEELASELEEIGIVLDEMTETYEDFWKSIGPLKPDWSDFDQFAQDKIDHRCDAYGESACQHVEMDLKERYGAIGSRIGILQQEDFDSTGIVRASPIVCPFEDHTCDILPDTRYPPRSGWQAIGAVDSTIGAAAADTIRAGVRGPTLPQNLGSLSSEAVPPFAVQVKNLVRALWIPQTVDLTPEPEESVLFTP